MVFLCAGLRLHEGMKQAWYLKQGQTLENTQIHERQNALICSKDAWKIFDRHSNKKRLRTEAIEREKQMNIYLKEGSEKMKNLWPDSTENLRRRRFENIQQQREEKKLTQAKRYVEMMEENEAERQALLKKIKSEQFQQNYHVRNLNRAALEAHVLQERSIQVAFQKKLREIEKTNENAVEPINYFEKFMGNEQEKLDARKHHEKQYRAELLHQIQATEERNQTEQTNQLQEERENLLEMVQEDLENTTEEYHARRRKQHAFRVGILETKRLHQEYLDHVEAIDREEDHQNEILLKYKNRIENILRTNARAERQRKHEISERISQKIFEQMQNNAQEEENRLRRAQDEVETQYLEKAKHKIEDKAKLVQELKEYYRKHDEEMKILQAEAQQRQQFEFLNRKKNEEMFSDYLENQRRLREDNIRTIKENLIAQQNAKKQKRDEENEKNRQDIQHLNDCLTTNDRQIIDYAERTIAENRAKSYPTLPIERELRKFELAHGYATTDRFKRNMANRKVVPKQRPGRRTTTPADDPTFGRCHCYKDRLFH